MDGKFLVLVVAIVLLWPSSPAESKDCSRSSRIQKKTYKSPAFSMGPGEVQNRNYTIEFPKGHIGVKNFQGEIVDELGNPVPLSEVYLHHWVVFGFYLKSSERKELVRGGFHDRLGSSAAIIPGNDGICQQNVHPQFWGLGAETRHTSYFVPGSYAIGVGNPPEGYKELWLLNVHAIDTRGTYDPQGCLECRCSLYNVTIDASGQPLKQGYKGGLHCCYEGTKCAMKLGFQAPKKTLYMQYTIEWVEWDECVRPVRAYIFDITDSRKRDPVDPQVGCQAEYDVPACDPSSNSDCIYQLENHLVIPKGGSIIYGVGHQHAAGMGISMHGEDGRHLCSSTPLYGNGSSPGNEDGYVVGMSTCIPKPGTLMVASGEKLHFSSSYSSAQEHTGVMGIFYLMVSDNDTVSLGEIKDVKNRVNVMVVTLGIVVVLALAVGFTIWNKKPESHERYSALLV
ncbi:hypothetical protein SELMODRAFT_422686 [Selaginella moellendorffii]|uniref:Uncharacterized protein n=1 Tax=Selaginella moellendorffii TaxID=88036 RepID=D8SJ77_SELML|nr:uncharacterized protein LOC9654892 [Selaginella moellendorffii]EFJ15748.1 hypothetical protein SELMODRAFT_422686 [Selaginella moellendorffii]|eukprot:XP_002983406.1 uncharacterized protein LOC9654892 [Selaginella moellendorffii]